MNEEQRRKILLHIREMAKIPLKLNETVDDPLPRMLDELEKLYPMRESTKDVMERLREAFDEILDYEDNK